LVCGSLLDSIIEVGARVFLGAFGLTDADSLVFAVLVLPEGAASADPAESSGSEVETDFGGGGS
jgi:hypothetical protein